MPERASRDRVPRKEPPFRAEAARAFEVLYFASRFGITAERAHALLAEAGFDPVLAEHNFSCEQHGHSKY